MGTHEGQRLVFDIEVAPAQGWFWRAGYGINVPASNITVEPAVICISYQWENEKKIHHLQWDKNQCDRAMLARFIPIMQEAGSIIGHNSDSFDIRWLRTRCLYHRLPCPPDFITIDTWKQAKKYFRFQGNSLKYISTFLGLKGKINPPPNLWQDVVFWNKKKAMKQMIAYCDRDVDQTMQVFKIFSPYTHAVGHKGRNMQDCAHCGSSNTKWEKDRLSTAGIRMTQFRCQEPGCHKYGTCASSKWYSNTKIK